MCWISSFLPPPKQHWGRAQLFVLPGTTPSSITAWISAAAIQFHLLQGIVPECHRNGFGFWKQRLVWAWMPRSIPAEGSEPHRAAATPGDPVCAGVCCVQPDSRGQGQQHKKTSSASFSNWGSGCSFTELQPVFLTLSTAQIIGVTFHFSLRREKTLGQKVLSSSPCLQPWVKRAIMFHGSEADTFSRLVKSNLPLLYHPADNETRWKKRLNVFPANSCC